jgi:hypothetical protein
MANDGDAFSNDGHELPKPFAIDRSAIPAGTEVVSQGRAGKKLHQATMNPGGGQP